MTNNRFFHVYKAAHDNGLLQYHYVDSHTVRSDGSDTECVQKVMREYYGVDLGHSDLYALESDRSFVVSSDGKVNYKIVVSEEYPKAAEPAADIPGSVSVFIQSRDGHTIAVDTISRRVAGGADTIYVKPEENRAYWVKGSQTGSMELWS